MVDFKSAAVAYAGMGWPVFPLAVKAKIPAIAKAAGGNGVNDATTDMNLIMAWSKKYPHANVGIACGETSGLVVIDIDPRNGGNASLLALGAKGRAFPDCPIARTGGGGLHMLFRFDEKIINSKNKLGPGIDVKSSGGYIVGAPSEVLQPSGVIGKYEWARHPVDVSPPRLPIWVSSMLAPIQRPPHLQPSRMEGPTTANMTALVEFVRKSGKGDGNNRLYWAACRAAGMVREHKVSSASAVDQLLTAAVSRGTPFKKAHATIASAFKTQGA